MNRNDKKRLYESIMKSVSKTIKHKLNEDANGDSSLQNMVDSLGNKIRKQEEHAPIDRLPNGLFNLLTDRLCIMGEDDEYDICNPLPNNCPYNSVDELTHGVYIAYNYDADSQDYKDDEKFCNFFRTQLMIITKKIKRMLDDFDCVVESDKYMMFIKYKGELNTNEDLKEAITYLAKIKFQIDSYFAKMFS